MAQRFPGSTALCESPKEFLAVAGLRGEKEIGLQALFNCFRVVLQGKPNRLSGLELLHYMDRDYLRGLIDASSSSKSLPPSERHRGGRLENVNEDEDSGDEPTQSNSQSRVSMPYNPLWGHIERPAMPPVGAGRDANSNDDFSSPFAVLMQRGDTDALPRDGDPLGRGLLKQGSDLSTMSSFFNDE